MLQKIKLRYLAAILGISLFCPGGICAGSIPNQISYAADRVHELENELGRAEQDIRTYQQEQKALEQDIADGQAKISQLAQELDHTLLAIDTKQEQISKTQKKLEKSKEECRIQYENMKKRIRFMYENSIGSMLALILESGSLSEALQRAEYFQSVVSYDRNKLEEYKAATKKITQMKSQLISEEKQLEQLETEQEARLGEIDSAVEALKVRLRTKMTQIQNSQALQQQYAKELEQQKAYEAELERKRAEEDRRRQEEIQRQEEELARQRETQGQQQDVGSSSSGSSGSSYAAGAGDLELLAAIIYCEAGNQPYEGQLAVGSVIMNRVASSSFPNSISGVIYQSGQFSPVSSGRFAQALAAGEGNACRSAAQAVLNGTRNVDCLYFMGNYGMVDGIVIGDHVFY